MTPPALGEESAVGSGRERERRACAYSLRSYVFEAGAQSCCWLSPDAKYETRQYSAVLLVIISFITRGVCALCESKIDGRTTPSIANFTHLSKHVDTGERAVYVQIRSAL